MQIKKLLSLVLVVALMLSVASVAVSAATFDTVVTGDYYQVLSSKVYNLAPGATETEMVLNNGDGTRRQQVHVFEVDTKEETLEVMPGYYGIDKLDPDNLSDETYWAAETVTKTAAYYEDNLGYNVVGAMNTALAYNSNAPYGYMVWNGVVLGSPQVHSGAKTYLAIDKEGNCELRSMSTPLDGSEWTAIPANFNWVVKSGELVTKEVERTSSPASRSMIGIKADGTLVFCQTDGRISPQAVGLSTYELGEMMLALGCVNAVNCDGGGSSTFLSKREGESELTMRSIPSDGAERATINSVILVSNAVPTGIFDKAVVSSDYDYYAANSTGSFETTGVDTNGYPVDVPTEGITWQLSDATFGTVKNGTFTSTGKTGSVAVQVLYNGEVVGEKNITVVNPDTHKFTLADTTVPYGRTVDIELACTYGADSWDVCTDGAYAITLSDNSVATLDGMKLTTTTDESKKGVVVTATYKADTSKTAVLNVTLGKGSEIVYNFEDGDLKGFMGFTEAKQWSIDNGVNNSLVGSDPMAGQYSPSSHGNTFISSAKDGGIVRKGDYALGWSIDSTDVNFSGWTYNILFNTGDTVVFRDVANGLNATRLGMWLYIPEGAAGISFQSQLYNGTTHVQDHFQITTVDGTVKTLNACTEADLPESRWVYVYIDIAKYDYLSTIPATNTSTVRAPSFIRTYVKPMLPAVHTFYIDDITLDYSSAVDDSVLPLISKASYTTADESVEFGDNTVINGTNIAFSATVTDNVSVVSGKIYIDGVEIDSAKVNGKALACDGITVNPGVHTVTFEAVDGMGNVAKATKTFTVAGDAVVTVTGHSDAATIECDSIYYADINVADITKVDDLTVSLKLQNANTWEFEGIKAATGFEATYSYNEYSEILTVDVKKVSDAVNPEDKTIVSIPIRLWSWGGYDDVKEEEITAATQFKGGYCPIVTIDYKVLKGVVNGTDTFGGKVLVSTNINDIANPWHTHDAELKSLEKEVTCTEDGYTGRTYCDGCKSVIDWGTKTEATGHSYKVVDGYIECEKCETVNSVSGLYTLDGNTYNAINGKLVSGWQFVDGNYYYFSPTTFAALKDGRYAIDGYMYTFDANGVHTFGQWVKTGNGTQYRFAGAFVYAKFIEIEGKTYRFNNNSYLVKGTQIIQVADGVVNSYIYEIDKDGVVKGVLDYTGLYELNGKTHYVVDGQVKFGLHYITTEENAPVSGYYYFNSSAELVTGQKYVSADKTNAYMNAGTYYFAEDGHMLDEEIYNINGVPYYMVDGVPYASGVSSVIEINGGIYYRDYTGVISTGKVYVENKFTNGLTTAGWHYTDETGRFYDNEFATVDGTLYYFVDGMIDRTGTTSLRDMGDGLYYIQWDGSVATGKVYVEDKYANGLTTAGYHYTDETGRFYDNEFATVDGTLYYFVNGKIDRTGKTSLRQINGGLYYIQWDGSVSVGKVYVETQYANGLTTSGWHYTDETGRFYDNEFATVDGILYYMVTGKIDRSGLTSLREINGGLYYIQWDGSVSLGKVYVETKYANGLTTAGWHYTDETGRFYNNEFTTIDGVLYYMLNGKIDRSGVTSLREINGGLYYIQWDGSVSIGKVYVETKYANGLTTAGWHYTDETGRFYNNEFTTIDGVLYYMVNGSVDRTGVTSMREINGYLYYIQWDGSASIGRVYVESKYANDLIGAGWHEFAADGKMIK